MKLNDGVEAALHCVSMAADLPEGAVLPAGALAEFFGLSPSYLLKQLKPLVVSGILQSVPGPNGGYRLAKGADQITLLDVVLAIEGREPAFRCREIRQNGPNPLPQSAFPARCGIHSAMLKAEKAYRETLASQTIADLAHDFVKTGDPRVMARGCAFLEARARA